VAWVKAVLILADFNRSAKGGHNFFNKWLDLFGLFVNRVEHDTRDIWKVDHWNSLSNTISFADFSIPVDDFFDRVFVASNNVVKLGKLLVKTSNDTDLLKGTNSLLFLFL